MPVACDDTDRDLPLAQRVATGLKMNAEGADDLCELWILDPDLDRARQAPARLDDGVIGILLFGCHLVVLYLGVASEGRGFRCHCLLPFFRCLRWSRISSPEPRQSYCGPGGRELLRTVMALLMDFATPIRPNRSYSIIPFRPSGARPWTRPCQASASST